ncbi:CerR family C-terminal domain-containing protein [Phyllobacterium sp. SB3]|uniref:CerR family C-terminal domain-containing protein n=1 Tax=Phyllobacterium sp. SB3 TaxID=3156073 RepID=UPI0032AFF038
MEKQTRKTKHEPSRGEIAREKLIIVALDLFGRYGFEGTSTRMLRDAAGVNLQAIPYYFGSKEGLYIATAEYLGGKINSHVSDLRTKVRGRIEEVAMAGQTLSHGEARGFLSEILKVMAALFISKESEPWARFLIREQMEPTEAFHVIYAAVMKPMFEVGSRLVGILLEEEATSEHVKLRIISLFGSLLIFRVAHAAAMRLLDWRAVGASEVKTIQDLVEELVAAIQPLKVQS